MSKIGYARVSSYGQSLDIQLEKLKDCDRIFKEKQSGRSLTKREQLSLCLDYVRDGDTLVVTRLDRLSRSTRDLLNTINILEEKKVKLHVLDQNIETESAAGRLLITMLGAIASFENDLRAERQSEGIAQAKRKGVKLGRKQKLTAEQIKEMKDKRESGVLIKELIEEYKMSKASIYRILELNENI